jgi:hypothetical protein
MGVELVGVLLSEETIQGRWFLWPVVSKTSMCLMCWTCEPVEQSTLLLFCPEYPASILTEITRRKGPWMGVYVLPPNHMSCLVVNINQASWRGGPSQIHGDNGATAGEWLTEEIVGIATVTK